MVNGAAHDVLLDGGRGRRVEARRRSRAQVAQLGHVIVRRGGQATSLRGPLLGVGAAALEVKR